MVIAILLLTYYSIYIYIYIERDREIERERERERCMSRLARPRVQGRAGREADAPTERLYQLMQFIV